MVKSLVNFFGTVYRVSSIALEKLVYISVVSVLMTSCRTTTNVSLNEEVKIIDQDKIATVDVELLSFFGDKRKTKLTVLDVIKNDVLQIFEELKRVKFPIYVASCYFPRKTRSRSHISLHAYAAAIDINYLMNPHYDAINGLIIPGRNKNQKKDERDLSKEMKKVGIPDKEIVSVLDIVIKNQPEDSDDRFLNRGIIRKGMVTPEVVSIFKKHGFNEWGGKWRRPIDYMHLQIPRSLAEQLAVTKRIEERKKIWERHKKAVNKSC